MTSRTQQRGVHGRVHRAPLQAPTRSRRPRRPCRRRRTTTAAARCTSSRASTSRRSKRLGATGAAPAAHRQTGSVRDTGTAASWRFLGRSWRHREAPGLCCNVGVVFSRRSVDQFSSTRVACVFWDLGSNEECRDEKDARQNVYSERETHTSVQFSHSALDKIRLKSTQALAARLGADLEFERAGHAHTQTTHHTPHTFHTGSLSLPAPREHPLPPERLAAFSVPRHDRSEAHPSVWRWRLPSSPEMSNTAM